jgi:bacteriorhodopsin
VSRSRTALAVVLVVAGLAVALMGLWSLRWEYAAVGAGAALAVIGLLLVDVGRAR